MNEEHSKILSVIERFKGDYRLDEKLRAVLTNKEPAYLTKILWENFRDYHIDLGEHRELWQRLFQDKDAYSGDDFIRLIKSINKHFPDATHATNYGNRYSIHSEEDLPGHFYGLRDLIEAKQQDKDFAQTLQEEWLDLPDPFRIAIGYTLAQFQMISYKDIPEKIAEKIAETHLRHSAGEERYWSRPHAFPPDVWGPLLVQTALQDPDITFEQAHVLRDLIPFCPSPQDQIALIARCRNTFSNQHLPTLGDIFPHSFLPHLEAHLQTLKVEPYPDDNRVRWPYFAYVAIYLRLCKLLSHTPPTFFDIFFQDFLKTFRIGWGGTNIGKFILETQELMQQIPQDRLEKIFLQQQNPHWYWLPACPTPPVLQHITDRLSAISVSPDYETQEILQSLTRSYYTFEHKGGLLGPIAQALVPYAKHALQTGSCPQRYLFVEILALNQDAEAIEGLAFVLQDQSKSIRHIASEALRRLPPQTTLPYLAPLLCSKRKETRLTVASLLAEYPPHPEVFALAQTQRATEKAKEILALLETIQAPTTTTLSTDESQILDDLISSKGETWAQHLHIGPTLISLYWRFLEKEFFGTYLSAYGSPYENWLALLEQLKHTPEALQHAALCIPAFDRWDGRTFLSAVADDFPELLEAIKSLIQQGRFHRPKSMGHYASGFDDTSTLDWFIEHRPTEMIDALIERTQDKRKTTRRAAFDKLANLGESVVDVVLPLIENKNIDTRCEAAEWMASFGGAKALAALQKAAPSEKHPRVQQAFQTAIAKLETEHFDISAFPETSEGHKALEQALARLPLQPLPATLLRAPLPTLLWKTGSSVASAAQQWIVAEVTQENFQRRSPLLRALRPRLSDTSCHALSEAIVAKGSRFDDGWPLYTQSIFGSPQQIDAIAAQLDKLASSRSTRWGDDGVEALARHGSAEAIRHLDHAHRKGKREALKSRAGRGLRKMAQERGMTTEELIESAISDMGFSIDGQMTLSYGPRAFRVVLADDFSMTLSDHLGKALKALPAPRKDDDAAQAEASQKHFASVKKHLPPLYKSLGLRLEDALRAQRRWPVAEWRARFLEHPLFYRLGKTLVWEALDPSDQPIGTFVLQDDFRLIQTNSKTYKLPTQGFVRLLHPISLTDKERQAWIDRLDAMGRKPLFPQLQREVFHLADFPETDAAWLVQLPAVGSLSFISALQKCGYERGDREDAGLIFSCNTKIGPYFVTLRHGGWYPEIMDDDSDVDIRSVEVSDEKAKIAWRELPPAVFSEIARDLVLLTRKGTR